MKLKSLQIRTAVYDNKKLKTTKMISGEERMKIQ